ncbi:hypothetical protein LTR53_013617 [Teratosphaeriaceae sp. CCFEE 6253]|nr:hypothetical protein LTR53_013617 [Teratosphaeriaceae sp. CCFEE 6253]
MPSLLPIDNDLVRNVSSEKAEILAQMLGLNHNGSSLLIHGNLHNHLPHVGWHGVRAREPALKPSQILGSAYLLGGSVVHLRATFNTVSSELETWQPSLVSIADDDEAHMHLGNALYQRAFVEFFERRLAALGDDWKRLIFEYLLDSDSPLLGATVGGCKRRLRALECQSAVEALALTAVDYNALAGVVDLHQIPQGDEPGASGALAVLQKIHHNSRFNDVFTSPGVQNTATILRSEPLRKLTLEYFESLDFSDTSPETAEANLRELTKVAVLLLCTISRHEGAPAELQTHKFDFYSRTNPPSAGLCDVWLLMVLAYIHQQRPSIKPEILEQTPLSAGSRDPEWRRLRETALGATTERGFDPHFTKELRTLWEFSKIWPGEEQMFLKAAVRFEHDFDGWTGYGREGEERMDVSA